MAQAAEERAWFHPETREAWRDWLGVNHPTATGVWLVTWKKASGRPRLPYAEAVEEALCVGWVDSVARGIDDDRSRLLFTPRARGSGWSRSNKERIARLSAEGLMLPAGIAVIDAAKADGSWSLLDEVEDLVEPAELRAALDADPAARASWDGFPRSAKRAILEWIVQAKRPETRERRIREAAEAASRGERANQWRPRA
jgi:uncharacterized protein YdeI (YjbR/CyaY-like superfamily)